MQVRRHITTFEAVYRKRALLRPFKTTADLVVTCYKVGLLLSDMPSHLHDCYYTVSHGTPSYVPTCIASTTILLTSGIYQTLPLPLAFIDFNN